MMKTENVYFVKMIPFILITGIIAVVCVRIRSEKRRAKGIKVNRVRNTVSVIFAVYLAGLISQTVLPELVFSDGKPAFIFADYGRVNLKPFEVFGLVLNGIKHGNTYSLRVNLIGNVVAFIPAGFFTSLLSGKAYTGIFFPFFLSFGIETAQYFLGRSSDIDDLLLNTLGGIIGTLIFLFVKNTHWAKRVSRKK